MANKVPRIGVAAIVRKDGRVLMGKRKGSHGAFTWAFPGGHLEFLENIEDCVFREIKEECGCTVGNLRRTVFTDDHFNDEDKHYITIYVVCDHIEGEPEILEPDKCDEWDWFPWSDLPSPLFLPIKNLKNQGFDPFINIQDKV